MGESTRGFMIQNGALVGAAVRDANIVVPEGVRSIAFGAFSGHHRLESITLPAGIKRIESNAFFGCDQLKKVVFSQGPEYVGDHAFSGCGSLTEILFADGLREIGGHAFCDCRALKRVSFPQGLKRIGSAAFSGCSALEEIVLPESLKEIGSQAFYKCEALRDVRFPQGLTRVGTEAFFRCKKMSSVSLPDSVKDVGRNAFCLCEGLGRVDLPEGLKNVENLGFSSCPRLFDENGFLILNGRLCAYGGENSSVTLPVGVRSIAPNVFGSRIHIKMPLQCPAWGYAPAAGGRTSDRFLLHADGSEISFLNADGTVAARVVLAVAGEWQRTADAICLSIRQENGRFDFEGYDNAFSSMRQKENKFRLALVRIETPYALSESSEKRYLDYLKKNLMYVAERLAALGQQQRLIGLCRRLHPAESMLQDLIDWTLTSENAELTAWLMQFKFDLYGGSGFDDFFFLAPLSEEDDAPDTTWDKNTPRSKAVGRYMGSETDIVFPARLNGVKIQSIAGATGLTPPNYLNLRRVTVPEGYLFIGPNAFAGCMRLEHIELPASLKSVGARAFAGCRSLRQFYIRHTVGFSGKDTFYGAKIDTVIMETTDGAVLPSGLFSGCEIGRLVIYGGKCTCKGGLFDWSVSYPTLVYINGEFHSSDVYHYGFAQNCCVLPLADFDESTLDNPMLRAIIGMEKRKSGD